LCPGQPLRRRNLRDGRRFFLVGRGVFGGQCRVIHVPAGILRRNQQHPAVVFIGQRNIQRRHVLHGRFQQQRHGGVQQHGGHIHRRRQLQWFHQRAVFQWRWLLQWRTAGVVHPARMPGPRDPTGV